MNLKFFQTYLVEVIQTHPQHFNESNNLLSARRLSDASIQSTISGHIENVSLSTIQARKYDLS